MYGYIYLTTNLINNKKYIGKHVSSKFDCNYKGSGILLQKAIKKYGLENFTTHILEKIDIPTICETLDELNYAEKYYIEFHNAVSSDDYYNVASGGDGGDIYHNLTEKQQLNQRKLISTKIKGRKQTTEWIEKRKMFGEKNPQYGKHPSKETRMLISSKVSGENNAMYGVTSPMKGKHHSKEAREKIRQSKIGPNNPNYGKVYTEEERERKSLSERGGNNPRAIKCRLVCLEDSTSQYFDCIKEALQSIGVSQGMYYHYKKDNKYIYSKITMKYYSICQEFNCCGLNKKYILKGNNENVTN